MKQPELMKRVLEGELCLVAEYRGTLEDEITMRDKATGASRKSEIMKHSLECGAKQIQLTQWPERGTSAFPDNYKSPFKKGDKVVCFVNNWSEKAGVIRAGGELHVLET